MDNIDRENKYRVWDEDEKRFWYFTLQEILERRMSYRGSWDEKILKGKKEEYIGIHETKRDGKEIYDGDYLLVSGYSHHEPEEDWEGFVVKGLLGWGIEGFNSSGEQQFYYLNEIGGSYITTYEVSGNMHENPNLLEQFYNETR